MEIIRLDKPCPYCRGKTILVLDNPKNGHFICENNHMWSYNDGSIRRQVYDKPCPNCGSNQHVFILRIPGFKGGESYHKYNIPVVNNQHECYNCHMPESENPDQYNVFNFHQEMFENKKIPNRNYEPKRKNI